MSLDISEVIGKFLYPVVEELKDVNFFEKQVQFNANGNNLATSEATFVFSGPPVLKPAKPFKSPMETYLQPIGGVQNYSLNQGATIIPWGELGSRLKRHAQGSGNYGGSMSRPEVSHSGLKWNLYSWLQPFIKDNFDSADQDMQLSSFPGPSDVNGTSPIDEYNEARHFVGLDSDLFGIPFGLLCITGSAGGRVIHIEYLENCFVQSYTRGVQAGNPLIMPNISFSVTRPVPYIDSDGVTLLSVTAQAALSSLKSTTPYQLAAPRFSKPTATGQAIIIPAK